MNILNIMNQSLWNICLRPKYTIVDAEVKWTDCYRQMAAYTDKSLRNGPSRCNHGLYLTYHD